MPKPQFHPLIFRDEKGRFLSQSERYSPKVALIQRWVYNRYVDIAERPLGPKQLVDLVNVREFERLKEATIPVKEYKSKSKYKAWDISEQIDKTPGIRRKDIKIEVTIADGKRQRTFSIYHKIKRNAPSSYRIFQRINEELGFMGLYLYKYVGGRALADRKGKQVRLMGVKVSRIL